MAKKTQEKERFLMGTFIGTNSKGERITLSINNDTPNSTIKTFIKDNPDLGDIIADKSLIEKQEALINRNKK